MKAQNRKETLELIISDMRHDAATLDGQPFNGHVIAVVFGRLMAAIDALAKVALSAEDEIAELKRKAASEEKEENVEYGCFCDLEPGEQPDKCVLEMEDAHCIYANARRKTGECVYWRRVVTRV